LPTDRPQRVRRGARAGGGRHVPVPPAPGGVLTDQVPGRSARHEPRAAGGVVPMTELIVRSGGLSTPVQDSGRHGHYAIGMPPTGAMDRFAHAVANMLVGNPDGAAVLEATYLGPTLEFTDSRAVAVTGVRCTLTINDEPASP